MLLFIRGNSWTFMLQRNERRRQSSGIQQESPEKFSKEGPMSSHRQKLRNCLGSGSSTPTYAAQWWVLGGLCLLMIFCSAGCTLGPDFVRPEAPKVEQYTHGSEPDVTVSADGQAQHFAKGSEVASDWWLFFNSSKLSDVIKDAVSSNPTLQAAQAS